MNMRDIFPSLDCNYDDKLRYLVWVVCDGTIVDHSKYVKGSIKRRIQFKLSKRRKIQTLRRLLDRMGAKYTYAKCKKEGLNKLQPYYIRLYSDVARETFDALTNIKQYPAWFTELEKREARIVMRTIAITDGSKSWRHYVWSTVVERDFRLIEMMCRINGIKTNEYNIKAERTSGFKSDKKVHTMGFWL